jgi:hypothetical protein
MLASEVTWLAFAVFSGLRTISYVPQIVRIAKDHNGASAISYPTWLLWTGAHVSTGRALFSAPQNASIYKGRHLALSLKCVPSCLHDPSPTRA